MNASSLKQPALAATLATLSLASLPAAADPGADDQWAFTVTPYLWLPNINGTLQFQLPNLNASTGIETGPNDYLENLDFALMVSGEARKGRWSIFTDLIYLDFSNENSKVRSHDGVLVDASVNLDTRTSLSGGVWTLVGGYAAVQQAGATLDVIGGFRYLDVDASADWTLSGPIGLLPAAGSVSQDKGLWDGIVGVRGQVKLGESNWSMPYYADIGSGDSDLTWQAMAGLAYSWGWGDVALVYRHLAYDMDDGKLLQDVEFSGPALGAAFHF